MVPAIIIAVAVVAIIVGVVISKKAPCKQELKQLTYKGRHGC